MCDKNANGIVPKPEPADVEQNHNMRCFLKVKEIHANFTGGEVAKMEQPSAMAIRSVHNESGTSGPPPMADIKPTIINCAICGVSNTARKHKQFQETGKWLCDCCYDSVFCPHRELVFQAEKENLTRSSPASSNLKQEIMASRLVRTVHNRSGTYLIYELLPREAKTAFTIIKCSKCGISKAARELRHTQETGEWVCGCCYDSLYFPHRVHKQENH